MEQSKLLGSPINENTLTDEAESGPLNEDEHVMYRSVLGSLM